MSGETDANKEVSVGHGQAVAQGALGKTPHQKSANITQGKRKETNVKAEPALALNPGRRAPTNLDQLLLTEQTVEGFGVMAVGLSH